MQARVQISLQAQGVVLPNDIRDWIAQHTLVRLVLVAARKVGVPAAPTTQILDEHAAFRPQMLLSSLTYCCATGVYGSNDIELVFT
jgi:hypothetical protein